MGKNNPLRKTHPERKNYKLYKDKKQWVTACATFLIAMGATAVTSTAVHADTNTANDNEASAETKVTTQQENSNQINLLNDNQKSATDSTNTASAASTPTTTDNQQSSQSKNNSTDQQTSKQTTNATSADQSATSNSSAKAANKSVTTNENATDSASTKATPSTTTDQKQTLTVNKNQTVDSQTASTALLASAKSTSTTPSTVRDNYDVDRNWTYTDTDGSVALTAYKGTDLNVFIPNSADFNQAGHTDVKEVSISSSVIKDLINNAEQNNEVLKSIVVSSKDGKKVKASDSDWSEAFAAGYASPTNGAYLNNSDLNNMDISNVTKMANIFQNDSALTDYEGFANWNIHSIAYQFIDTDPIGTDTNVQINYNVIVSGKAGETVNTDLSVPTDFELVDSETLPTTITVPEKIRLYKSRSSLSHLPPRSMPPWTHRILLRNNNSLILVPPSNLR